MPTPQPLTAAEKERCLEIWGCVPLDVDFVRNSNFFQKINTTISIEEKQKSRTADLIKMHGKWAKYYE